MSKIFRKTKKGEVLEIKDEVGLLIKGKSVRNQKEKIVEKSKTIKSSIQEGVVDSL